MGVGIGNGPVGVGKIKINDDRGRGWTETYYLKGNSYVVCHANFAPIINYRHSVLAGNIYVADWSISDSNRRNDSFKSHDGIDLAKKRIIGDTAGPPVVLEKCNNLGDCINVRFASGNSSGAGTMDGKGFTHQFRGVRDSWISDREATGNCQGMIDLSYVTTALADGISVANVWFSLLRVIMAGCVWTKHTGPQDDTGVNEVRDLVAAVVRPFAGTRDTGRDPTASKGRIKRQYV